MFLELFFKFIEEQEKGIGTMKPDMRGETAA